MPQDGLGLRIGSLFSGIGGLELGLEWAGVGKTVYQVESDTFCKAQLARHWPGVPQFDDITKLDVDELPAADVVVGGFPCFPGHTPITTSDGVRPISTIKVGDRVLTHEGRFRKVLSIDSRPYNGELVVMKATGSLPLEPTTNHPILVREKKRIWPRRVRGKRKPKAVLQAEEKWIRADQVKQGMFVRVPAPVDVDKSEIPREARGLKPDFWWIIGFWLAEGWRKTTPRRRSKGKASWLAADYRVTFAANKAEKEGAQARIERYFHVCPSLESTSCWKLVVFDKFLWNLLKPFGCGAVNKRLPSWTFALPLASRRELLRGYIDGDGHWYEPESVSQWRAGSVSKALMLGIQSLAFTVEGLMPSVHVGRKGGDIKILGRNVKTHDSYEIRQNKRHRSTIVDERGAWGCVRNVSRKKFQGRVFNMEVEDDHTYTASGIAVHNCQDISVAGVNGERAGLQGARSGLWTHLARVVEHSRPEWVVVENVARGVDRWLPVVRGDLERLGYATLPVPLEARVLGAPHVRPRIFVLAHADGFEVRELEQRLSRGRSGGLPDEGQAVSVVDGGAGQDRGWWGQQAEPSLSCLDDGLPRGLGSTYWRAVGNAVVPQCAEVVGWMIRELVDAGAKARR